MDLVSNLVDFVTNYSLYDIWKRRSTTQFSFYLLPLILLVHMWLRL